MNLNTHKFMNLKMNLNDANATDQVEIERNAGIGCSNSLHSHGSSSKHF